MYIHKQHSKTDDFFADAPQCFNQTDVSLTSASDLDTNVKNEERVNDSRMHVVEPPRGRSFIWQIGVNSSIQDRRQVDRGFLWSRVSCTRQR